MRDDGKNFKEGDRVWCWESGEAWVWEGVIVSFPDSFSPVVLCPSDRTRAQVHRSQIEATFDAAKEGLLKHLRKWRDDHCGMVSEKIKAVESLKEN